MYHLKQHVAGPQHLYTPVQLKNIGLFCGDKEEGFSWTLVPAPCFEGFPCRGTVSLMPLGLWGALEHGVKLAE